jgi:hypothetical protein
MADPLLHAAAIDGRNWNTNAPEVSGNPFSAVGRMSVVPAKRIAALAVVNGTTSTTGNPPAY